MLEQGLVHVYYGSGKGKTSAAIGLGIRGLGNGLKVCMVQFLKTKPTGELEVLKRLKPEFSVFRLESAKGFFNELSKNQRNILKEEVEQEFELARKLCFQCDILILDEILGAVENGLLKIEDIKDFIKAKPKNLELVLTGRKMPAEIEDCIHYISEIVSQKHPGDFGISARKGIEF